ncbi:hypothetical protein CASFOL_017516 [Castilleja foliolosa]|uniref:RRM domain-containing protein n=1 Tax=Castilleja foliolosa TaxID=1961234 RepID=A0ABD3DET3_9LAMI
MWIPAGGDCEGHGVASRVSHHRMNGVKQMRSWSRVSGTTADDLFPLFDKYGNVVDVFIPIERRTGDSRGFAFVRYKYQDEAQKAVEKLDEVAKYQEAKPGVFTIVMFLFLFAVMFGDWGQGICLLLTTSYAFYSLETIYLSTEGLRKALCDKNVTTKVYVENTNSFVDRKVIERLLKILCLTAVESGTRALQYLGLDEEKNSVVFDGLKGESDNDRLLYAGMTGFKLLQKIKLFQAEKNSSCDHVIREHVGSRRGAWKKVLKIILSWQYAYRGAHCKCVLNYGRTLLEP